MLVTLRYGRDGLNVALPDSPNVSLLRMPVTPSIADSAAALADALANPIASRPLGLMATGRSSACITVSDITRPVPNALIVPQLLNVLNAAGVPAEYVTAATTTARRGKARSWRCLAPRPPGDAAW